MIFRNQDINNYINKCNSSHIQDTTECENCPPSLRVDFKNGSAINIQENANRFTQFKLTFYIDGHIQTVIPIADSTDVKQFLNLLQKRKPTGRVI